MVKAMGRFPCQVALAALVVYGVTLAHGVTMNSLDLTAKVAGWDWRPMTGQPVLWLLTLPLRWLPAAGVAVGLNLFSIITAALTLGLLARTVQLLPWDQPWETSSRLPGLLPALLACVVCGFEFSFWRDATAATGWEFCWIYRCESEGPFVLHPDEIETGGWFAPAAVTKWANEKPEDFASCFVLLWGIFLAGKPKTV